jgi:LuxR family quorum-sensing system transcriptional regulator SolR
MRSEYQFEAFVEASQKCSSVEQLKSTFGRFAAAEGYDNHVLTTVGDHRLVEVGWFDLPANYAEAYVKERWETIDPILPVARRAATTFYWHEALQGLSLTKAQRSFFGSCGELGVRNGVVMPIHGPNGRCDIISLSRRNNDEADTARLPLLRAVATQAWARFQELNGARLVVERAGSPVTPREREVLKWLKAGKSNREIAELMSVTTKAIEFHVRNMMDKLGAPNRIALVVIALQNGMLR